MLNLNKLRCVLKTNGEGRDFLSKHWGGAQFEGILPQYVRDKDGNFVGEKINNDF